MDVPLFLQVFQQIAYGQVLLDESMRIRLWNRWMEDRSRRASERVLGKDLEEAMGFKLSRRIHATIERCLSGAIPAAPSQAFRPHPLPLRDPADPRKWLVHSMTVRGLRTRRGRPYCLLNVHDLSRAHTREALLRSKTRELRAANQRLANKNKDLDEFVHQVSHDLQEPLRKVIAFSDLLEVDLGQALRTDVEQDLFYIRDASRRMSSMIEDLLSLSRAGNSAMHWDQISIEDCVAGALEALSLRIEETGAVVDKDELPLVHGDMRMLTQLYQNLAANGLKFVENGPPRLRFTCERIAGDHVLGVQDNGIGIDPEDAAAIFAPFRRLHGRDEFAGTGIGLSICQKVVQRHGGRIWVESEPGRGAHFRFILGKERPKGAQDPGDEPGAKASGGADSTDFGESGPSGGDQDAA